MAKYCSSLGNSSYISTLELQVALKQISPIISDETMNINYRDLYMYI